MFTGLSKEEAEKKEIELIAKYKSDQRAYGYNIQHGGNTLGKQAEETKKKISIANKGKKPWSYGKHLSNEARTKLKEFHTGLKLSEETKKKISVAHKGRKLSKEHIEKISSSNKGRKRTEEQRKRISDSLKGRKVTQSVETREKISHTLSKQIKCIETDTIYYGIREASRITKIPNSSICECLKNKIKTAGGYHWEYIQII